MGPNYIRQHSWPAHSNEILRIGLCNRAESRFGRDYEDVLNQHLANEQLRRTAILQDHE